jgi:hypothetical protein
MNVGRDMMDIDSLCLPFSQIAVLFLNRPDSKGAVYRPNFLHKGCLSFESVKWYLAKTNISRRILGELLYF